MSMLFLMSTIIVSLSVLFTQTTHPLALGMTLLIQTIIVSGATSMLANTTWFSYILFLIFLGAMLVLFIYVASLAPNEAFSLSTKLIGLMVVMPSIGVALFAADPLLLPLFPAIESSFSGPDQALTNFPASLSPMYCPQSVSLTLFIIIYLLLTLIVAVKIASAHYGALRLT
uniref:NADH dehydrogenase subunit 6 n=1 Tax=Caridina pseudogracilirostris TaxID=1042303 RepID=UPI002551F4F6|nr:NADH dehydrogenase subunit 6 [Caridina pseudogracilirostris]WGU19671.1 NADH dehydrogenase subunit 6 [Caridina pseudogracilirostris]